MQVRFFVKEDGTLDTDAIKGGVYHVELLKENNDNRISLYIGESAYMVERCGRHLFEVFNEPSYFGFEQEDIKNNSLILEISVLETIKTPKPAIKGQDNPYHKLELKYIGEINPMTQLSTSDKQKEESKRVEDVQKEMKRYKFK